MNTSMAITLVCHGSYRVTFLLTGGVHGVSPHYKQDFAFSNCLLEHMILTIIVLTLDTLLTTTQP